MNGSGLKAILSEIGRARIGRLSYYDFAVKSIISVANQAIVSTLEM